MPRELSYFVMFVFYKGVVVEESAPKFFLSRVLRQVQTFDDTASNYLIRKWQNPPTALKSSSKERLHHDLIEQGR